MSAQAPEQASHLPTVHEYGQRAFPESAAGPAVAGPSQPTQVSPQTSEATPATRQAEPVSPEQETVQAAQQEAAAGQPNAVVANAAVANTADAEPAQPQETLPPITRIWKWTYLIASGVIVLLSIIGLGLDAKAVTVDYYNDALVTIIFDIAFALYALTIVFVSIEVTVRAVNKWEQGIHPAVHTAIWLVSWLIYAALVIIFALLISFDRRYADDDYYDDDYHGYSRDPYFVAQLVFSSLLLVGTFFLFVLSCMETQAYNLRMSAPAALDATGTMASNYYDHRAWRKTKLVLSIMVIVAGIIGLAIGVSLVQYVNVRDAGLIFPACAAVLILPIGWAIADVCFSVCGKTRRKLLQGMAPGAHVGMWLISWIAISIIAGILTTYATILISDCRYDPNGNMRRSVAMTGLAPHSVAVLDAAIVPRDIRDLSGGAGGFPTSTLPTSTTTHNTLVPAATSTTSTRVFGRPQTTPTPSPDPFGDDPYDPYGDDPYGDDPYDNDPYSSPYNRGSGSGSSSSGSGGSSSSGSGGSSSSGSGGSSSSGSGSSSSSGSGGSSSSGSGSSSSSRNPYSDYPYGYGPNSGYEDDSRNCITDAMVGPIIATCVFVWIVFLLSFILFVAGCSDTYLRNRRPSPSVVYVAVQPLPYGQYPTQPIYAAAPMAAQEKQPIYAGAPMAGNLNQPMMQAPPLAPMQQPQPGPQGGVVEYYGTAR